MKVNLILLGATILLLALGWQFQSVYLLSAGAVIFLIFLIKFFIKRIGSCLMIGLALLVFSGLIFSFVFIKYIRPGGPYGIDKRKEPETLVASSVFADKIGDFKKVMDYKIDELKGYKFNIPVSMAIYEKEGKRIKVAVSIFKDEKESALAILGFKKQLEGQEYKISMRYGLGNWERQIFKEPFFPATILTWENVNTKEAGIMWNNRNYCFIVSDADAGTRDEFVQSFQH